MQHGLVARIERRALDWLIPRVPPWVSADALTFLGLAAMAAAGVCYALTRYDRFFLAGASAGLAINWLGDSLDGGVAQHRKRSRPKYGYYLDHLVDAYSLAFILIGLAFSRVITPAIAFIGLAVYLILCINTYLAAHTVGVFKLSYGGISATEGRLLLILFNTITMLVPAVTVLGHSFYVYDVAFVVFILYLTVLTMRSAWLCLSTLDKHERAAWGGCDGASTQGSCSAAIGTSALLPCQQRNAEVDGPGVSAD